MSAEIIRELGFRFQVMFLEKDVPQRYSMDQPSHKQEDLKRALEFLATRGTVERYRDNQDNLYTFVSHERTNSFKLHYELMKTVSLNYGDILVEDNNDGLDWTDLEDLSEEAVIKAIAEAEGLEPKDYVQYLPKK